MAPKGTIEMRIGVLALQGDFYEHSGILDDIGAKPVEVRTQKDFRSCDGLIVPGGESTAIARLLEKWEMFAPLKELARNGFPMFGTCAGLILLSRQAENGPVPTLVALDVDTLRNGYGRQIDSFEASLDLKLPGIQKNFCGVFIRAPKITKVGSGVKVLARYEGSPVLVRQENLLGASFHPELTSDRSLHRFFVEKIARRGKARSS